MASNLYTIGYEGHSVESFLDLLKKNSVKCLLDVRAMPLSHKQGFSKNTLKNHLHNHHIDYVHLPDLGSPKEIRDKVKKTKDYDSFFAAMEKHLAGQADTLKEACNLARQTPCCLLCFEKDWRHCHRSLVAKKIKAKIKNMTITNL